MPVYELTSAKTGQNYRVDFDRDPVEADVDEAVNHFDHEFARQNGVDPAVLNQGPLGTVVNKVRDVGPAVVGGLMETGGNLLGAGARLVGLPDSLPQGIAGLGADLQEEGRRLRPTNPANVTANTIGSGLQQGIGLVATMGAAAPVVGVKAALGTVPLVMGGIQGGGQGVMTARDMGIESPAGQLGMGAAFSAAEMLVERMGGAGSKALTEAVQRGLAGTFKQAGKTMGSEALEEPGTGFAQDAATWLGGQAVEDPNRPGFTTTGYELPKLNAAMLERRKQEAIGGAAGGTVFAGLQLALPNNDTLPSNQTPAQAGPPQAPGTTPATAPLAGALGPVPSTLSRIAQESIVADLPEDTGALTAEDVQDLEVPGSRFQVQSSNPLPAVANPDPAQTITGSNVQMGSEMPVPPPTAEAGAGAGVMGQAMMNDEGGMMNETADLPPLMSRAAPRLDFSGLMQNAQAVASGQQAPQTSAALNSMINAPGQRTGPVPQQAGPRGVARFFPASSNQQPGSSILPFAYREATRGSSTQMAPLSTVFINAKRQNPALTVTDFLSEVQAEYDAGRIYLEGANTEQEVAQAGLSLPGTNVGTAIRMMPAPEADRAQRINPYGMQRRKLPKTKPKEARATPPLTNPDSTLANALQPEAEVPAAMRGVVFNAISSLESLWGLSLGKVQSIGLKLIPKSSRDHGEYVVRGHIALNDNLSDAQLANTAVHEFAHHLHHAHTPGSGFDLEQHAPLKQLMGVLTRTASFKELQIAARANTGSQTKMAKWLRYAADPKELLARSIERATAKLAGRAQPNYGDANVYTLLTDAEIDAIIPYVRSYFQSLSVGSVLPENRQSELGRNVGEGRGTTGPDEVSGRSVGTAGIGDSGGIGDEVARSTPAPERRENRSRIARPEQAERMYDVQGNDVMLAEAAQWLATVDNATAVQQLESGLPPAGLRKDHLPALAEQTMQRLVQTMASDKELVRLQAEALLDRAGIAWQDVINREAGRGLQQVGAANARLIPIAPILAVKRILVDRADAIMDKRFEGGAEGAVEKVKVIIQKVDAQAGDEVAQAVQDTVELAPPVDPAAARAAVQAVTKAASTYFGGTLPARVKILHQEQAEWDARMNGNVLELNAAALETAQVPGKIEHEIGHLLFQDPAMRQYFDALWGSLDVNERAQIENITAALYDAANRNEEASVRALDSVRQMVETKNPSLWQRFVIWLRQAWERFTGKLPRDPRRLAAVMIETGVARLKGVEGNQTDVRESRRSDLLKVNSPQLAKLLNAIRSKVAPGMKWRDIFEDMPSAQKARQLEIYKRLMQHRALLNLSANERLQLTNELDKAWQRARKKVFDKELEKAGVLGEKDASDRKKAKAVLPKMLRMINLGMFDSAAWREAVAPQYGLKMLTSADTAQLRTLAEAAWKQPEGVLRNQKLRDMLNAMQKKTGASTAELLNSYWTAAVLSGLRTQFDTYMAAINGMGTNLMQIGGLIARGQGRAAIDAHAQWWRGLMEGVRESGQILFKGNTSYLKRFGADLMKALEGETSVTPVPLGENLWKNGNTFQKYGLAPVMMFTGRLMAAADHINNTATTQGAIAVARALNPELYEGKVGFTKTERDNARAQALQEVTGGREPQTSEERAILSTRVRELLNGSLKPADYAAASEIGDMAAFQNDPTGVFGIVYSAMKQGLGSIQRGLGNVAEDVTANKFARVATGVMAGSLHGITGTRFMRFGANFGAEMTRYIPGSYALGKAGFYGRNVSRMQQELLLGKNLVGLMLGSTLAAVFLAGDDDDEGWQIEGDWSTLTPQEAKERMSAGLERMTLWKRENGQVKRVSYKQWPTMGLFSVVGGMLDEKRHKPAQWASHGTAGHLMRGVATGYVQVKNVSAVRNLVELFGEPSFSADGVTGAIDKFVKTSANFTGGFVPTLVKDAEIWSDPRNFKPEGVAEQFLRSVPLARKFINDGRPQLNLLGEEVKLQRSPWSRAYTSVESAEAHRVLGALMARGLSLPMPSDQVHVIKDNVRVPLDTLGREAVYRYEKAVGQGYKDWLSLEGSDLLKMSVEDASNIIKRRADAIKSRAKAAVLR